MAPERQQSGDKWVKIPLRLCLLGFPVCLSHQNVFLLSIHMQYVRVLATGTPLLRQR